MSMGPAPTGAGCKVHRDVHYHGSGEDQTRRSLAGFFLPGGSALADPGALATAAGSCLRDSRLSLCRTCGCSARSTASGTARCPPRRPRVP